MASYGLRADVEERRGSILEMYVKEAGGYTSRAYCLSFFSLLAASLAALRLAGSAVETWGGEPLLQPWWCAATRQFPWLMGHVGFGALVMSCAYILSCTYFTSLDMRSSSSTKLQEHSVPSFRETLVAALPQIVVHSAVNFAWYNYAYQLVELPRRAPTVPLLLEQVTTALIIGDFLLYWEHRLMHSFVYTRDRIHSWRHSCVAPSSWAGGGIHPLEGMLLLACVASAPIILGYHPLSFWVYLVLCTVHHPTPRAAFYM